MIGQVSHAMGVDDLEFNISGLYWEHIETTNKPLLRLVGTDGHRLAITQMPYPGGLEIAHLVPFRAIGQIYNLLKGQDMAEVVLYETITVNGKKETRTPQFAITSGGQTVGAVLADHGYREYPNYRRIIPETFQHHFTVDRHGLLDTLNSLSQISNERFKGAIFTLDNGVMNCSYLNYESGRAEEDVPVRWRTGKAKLIIGFNLRYLIESLSVLRGDLVEFRGNAGDRPWQITEPDNENFKEMIMPHTNT